MAFGFNFDAAPSQASLLREDHRLRPHSIKLDNSNWPDPSSRLAKGNRPGKRGVRTVMARASRLSLPRRQEVSSPIVSGFMPSVLGRIHSPDIGLAIWQRFTRRHLWISASALLMRPAFTVTVVDTPDMAARRVCRGLMLFHWPLYADLRRLAGRFSSLTASPVVRMRLEHETDDSCRKFHVDAVGLRLLCTYAGPGTEWIAPGGKIRRMVAMEVAIFKGAAFPGVAPRVLHRSPPLSTGTSAGRSRLVLCIDVVS